MVKLVAASYVRRNTGAFLSAASNFNVKMWLRIKSSAINRVYYTITDGTSFIKLRASTAFGASHNSIILQAYNGSGSVVSSSTITLKVGVWYPICIRYLSAGSIQLFMNTKNRASISINMTAVTFTDEILGSDLTTFSSNVDIAMYRSWQTDIAGVSGGNNLRPEDSSLNAVNISNLFCDTPLDEDGDDDSGNSRHWVAAGLVEYFTGLPLYIPPPINSVIADEDFSYILNSGPPPQWGWFNGTFPTTEVGVGCNSRNLRACATSSLFTTLETTGRGLVRANISFRYYNANNKVSGENTLIYVDDYINSGAPASRTNIQIVVVQDGSFRLTLVDGVSTHTVTAPAGTLPIDGTNCGIQLIIDLASSLIANCYVNNVFIVGIDTADLGLASKTFNQVIFNNIRQTVSGTTWNDAIGDIKIVTSTGSLGNVPACDNSRVLLVGTGACSQAIVDSNFDFVWSKVSGPSGSVISDPDILDPIITFTKPGKYVYRLTATSDCDEEHDDVVIIVLADCTVSGAAPYPSL